MVGGQILDLEAERGPFDQVQSTSDYESVRNSGSDSERSTVSSSKPIDEIPDRASAKPVFHVEQLIQIHRMKTGALISAALELGSIVANATAE